MFGLPFRGGGGGFGPETPAWHPSEWCGDKVDMLMFENITWIRPHRKALSSDVTRKYKDGDGHMSCRGLFKNQRSRHCLLGRSCSSGNPLSRYMQHSTQQRLAFCYFARALRHDS